MLQADPRPVPEIPVPVAGDANIFNLLKGNHIMKVIRISSYNECK